MTDTGPMDEQVERAITVEMLSAGRAQPGVWGYSDDLLRNIYLAMRRLEPASVIDEGLLAEKITNILVNHYEGPRSHDERVAELIVAALAKEGSRI